MSKKMQMYLIIAAIIIVVIVIYNKSKLNPANVTPVNGVGPGTPVPGSTNYALI